jgi:uncharacterized protein (DUF1697 family)
VGTTSYVALLRAINVGGRNAIAMAELRAMCAEIGLSDARTLLQSGNLVVRTGLARAKLAALLAHEIERRFGHTIDIVVRSAAEWSALIAANPFPDAARVDPSHLVVLCCTHAPTGPAVARLAAAIAGREQVRANGADIYLTYPDGIGESRLTNAVIERHLATNGTARNWNTVTKLAAMLRGE